MASCSPHLAALSDDDGLACWLVTEHGPQQDDPVAFSKLKSNSDHPPYTHGDFNILLN